MISTILTSGIITKVCAGLFGTSSLIVAAKNNGAKNKIERQGFVVDSDRRSITERAISFIKDYFYLAVPGLNIVKSFKLFLKNDEEYAEERKALYDKRERLFKVEDTKKTGKKKEPVKTESKVEKQEKKPVKTETKKVVKTQEREPVKPAQPTSKNEVINPFAGLNVEQLEDLKRHYVRIDDGLRKKWTRKVNEKAPVAELNAIVDSIESNMKLYDLVNERLEILKVATVFDAPRRLK